MKPLLTVKAIHVVQFLLTTIIVMDRHMNGIPVAFFVHSRGTTRIIRDCLTALLKAAREVQPDFKFGSVGCDAATEEITAITCDYSFHASDILFQIIRCTMH